MGVSRALAIPVKGKIAWRTCRNCDRRMRIERFAPAETISGYGPHCYPCRRAVTQREARLVHFETKRDRAKATRRAGETIMAQKSCLTDTALKIAQELAEEMAGLHPRTNGDTRFEERLRRCLGPCRELFRSSHCAHRFCPGCLLQANRSTCDVEISHVEFYRSGEEGR